MKYPLALLLSTGIVLAPGLARGAVGDVSFRIDDAAWQFATDGLTREIDLQIDIEGAPTVAATGWGAVVRIFPQPGASGTLAFSPPPIVDDLPNLSPADVMPFVDFDRDAAGKSYGVLGGHPQELSVFAAYVAPISMPTPTLDGAGNLALPDGVGLTALPLTASPDAAGAFLIALEPDPAVTGVVFSTGIAPPDDVALHPTTTHQGGLLTIYNLPGDYTHDGNVTGADFLAWQRGNSPAPRSEDDLNHWQAEYGVAVAPEVVITAVPEPALSLIWIATTSWLFRRRRTDPSPPPHTLRPSHV